MPSVFMIYWEEIHGRGGCRLYGTHILCSHDLAHNIDFGHKFNNLGHIEGSTYYHYPFLINLYVAPTHWLAQECFISGPSPHGVIWPNMWSTKIIQFSKACYKNMNLHIILKKITKFSFKFTFYGRQDSEAPLQELKKKIIKIMSVNGLS